MLAAVRRKTLVEETADRLRGYIREEGLDAGHALPSERELSEQLQVGRSTVREALKLLQAWGWVEMRPQRGAVVASPDLRPLQELLWERVRGEHASLREMWEVRRLLEVGMLRWVADRAGPEDWARLERAVEAMEEAVARGGPGLQPDIAFHEALVQATHNRLFISLREMAAFFFEEIQRQSGLEGVDVRRNAAREHRRILEALRGGDVATAEAVMAEHLEGAVRRGVVPPALPNADDAGSASAPRSL